MEQPQNFRSAFNGFNREDVVHYLEFINTKHNSETIQLRQEADELRRKLDQVDPEREQELERRCEELASQLDAANAEKAEQDSCLEELRARVAELENALEAAKAAQPEEAPVAPAPQQYSAVQELEAYRRAERAERMAKERAERVYRQTSGILADATVKVDEAAKQIGTVTDQVMAQLNLLQCAVSSSRLALQEAAATMCSLRPESEEE